ncbi:MAG TPA: KH domain-containing protein [Terriglobales bacterium]|nr:KH domain-containing protein [Terriglobales bacterium]
MEEHIRITAWLTETAKLLVDTPEAVAVRLTTTEPPTLHLSVSPTDIGKIVGKQGRMARSLRTILGAIGMATGQRYALDISAA